MNVIEIETDFICTMEVSNELQNILWLASLIAPLLLISIRF